MRKIWGVIAVLGLLGCARNVRLVSAETSPGARYVCTAKACSPAGEVDPSHANARKTVLFTLPPQCARVHEILVLDAQKKQPRVEVACAPPEPPGLGGMQ